MPPHPRVRLVAATVPLLEAGVVGGGPGRGEAGGPVHGADAPLRHDPWTRSPMGDNIALWR